MKSTIEKIFNEDPITEEEREELYNQLLQEYLLTDPNTIEKELEAPSYDKHGILIAWEGGNTYECGWNNPKRSEFGDNTNYYRKRSKRKLKTDYPVTDKVWVVPKHLKNDQRNQKSTT